MESMGWLELTSGSQGASGGTWSCQKPPRKQESGGICQKLDGPRGVTRALMSGALPQAPPL